MSWPVLKPLAAPLLNQIKPWDEAYIEARRLSASCTIQLLIPSRGTSPQRLIMREFTSSAANDY
jgi:hypothetical protein